MPYDETKADKAVKFIKRLKHTKGRWAGVPFTLLPWQENEIIRPLFGTVKEDGTRQYRFCYIEVGKKNGKSEIAAAIALYLLLADGEISAEVYNAAGDRDQASIVFDVAAQMVRQDKTLIKRCKIIDSRKRIVAHKTNSVYIALSKETYTKHGLNPSGVIIDELHAHKTRELYDILIEGTDTARQQQLIFIITTAGIHDIHSIGWEVHEYAKQVKKGIIKDPTFLPIIYAANQKDDWTNEKIWKKANPSLGHIFTIDKLKNHYNQVKDNPARQNNFRRFRLNQWVGQVNRYFPMDKWDACGKVKFDPNALVKRRCYGGLDLSSTMDLTAFVLVFPPEDKNEKWKIIPKFYIPEDTVLKKTNTDKVPYLIWKRAGYITVTPGNVIDYEFIRKDIQNASNIYNLKEVAYDPWGAVQLATKLQEVDGIIMVEHRQGFKSMSPPTKECHKMIMSKEIAHNNNPILRWCADNFVAKIDAAENVKPDKEKVTQRIDGIVALIMALGRAILYYQKRKSIYETSGLKIL